MTGRGDDGARIRAAAALRPAPLKRFYKSVTVAPGPAQGAGGLPTGFGVLLDNKPLRTPAKAKLTVPTRALAEAVAAEWEAQGEHVDGAAMPMTRLVNSAIDGVATRLADVRADIVAFAASDLVCYRAEEPGPLVQRQRQHWDPVIVWAREALGARLEVAAGLMPVTQPQQARASIVSALEGLDAFRLAALHVMTTLTGSALLALAHAGGALTAEAAWAAAHVDEDFQISQWGEDAEAAARRSRRWAEMQAASRMLELLGR